MVLVLTNTGEALYWGVCNDLTMDSSPRHVKGRSYPREIFTMSAVPDSGGTVYLGRIILYQLNRLYMLSMVCHMPMYLNGFLVP